MDRKSVQTVYCGSVAPTTVSNIVSGDSRFSYLSLCCAGLQKSIQATAPARCLGKAIFESECGGWIQKPHGRRKSCILADSLHFASTLRRQRNEKVCQRASFFFHGIWLAANPASSTFANKWQLFWVLIMCDVDFESFRPQSYTKKLTFASLC